MPKLRFFPIVLSILAFFSASALAASQPGQPPIRPNLLTPGQWTADLKFLAETLPKTHRHAFDKVAPEVFSAGVADLEKRIPTLRDHEVIVGLARLVALLRDGHSRLTLPLGSGEAIMPGHMATAPQTEGLYLRVLPVKLLWLEDGVFVQAAAKDRADLLGARLIRIGGMDAASALEAVRPVVSYDSEMWFKNWAPQMLAVPEILHALRIADSPDTVPLVFRLRDGREAALALEAMDPGLKVDWITASQTAKPPKPLYLRNPGDLHWFEYDPQTGLFYCQINGIQDKPEETLAQFSARMIAAAEAAPFAKFVLDVRLNGGGNNYLNRTLILALVRSSKINRYGTFFVVIGRNTFSAAQSLVNDLVKWTNAVFVGEPTGNSPNQYGDSKRVVLPNSRLTVRLSSLYWRDSFVDENRNWVAPDLSAPLTSAAYLENRDPALEKILAYQVPDSLLGILEEKFEWGGLDAAAAQYYKYRNSPETVSVDTEKTLIGLAEYLKRRSKNAEAVQLLQRAAVEYPKSFDAHFELGRYSVEQGDKAKAMDALKKALALRPGDPAAAELLAKAEKLK